MRLLFDDLVGAQQHRVRNRQSPRGYPSTRLDGVERDKRGASTHRRGTLADMEEAMEVGYFAVGIGPTFDPEWVRTIATTAERLGFATIWAPEHVVLLEQYASKYPGCGW
jgi:hypothetical protein